MKTMTLFLLLMNSILLTSCQSQEAKPVDPIWDKQACSNCRMVLSEKRFAVQKILKSGEVLYYDDLNCALNHNHPEKNEAKIFVRPHEGDSWTPAKEARYVSGLKTPMNSGYGAVKEGGTLSFVEVKKKLLDE